MSGGFCPSCGAATAAEARFCAACGKALTRLATPAAPGAQALDPQQAETTVFELRPLVVRTVFELLGSIVTAGILFVFLWIPRMRLRYRITTERIETREGVATVHSRFVDLFRIEDFELKEPFYLRMRGAGHLIVRSMDKDEPIAVLTAIPDVRGVYERLRTLTRDERFRKGVRVVEEN